MEPEDCEEWQEWQELMEEAPGHVVESSEWKDWADTTIDRREMGTAPLVDRHEVWSWLRMSNLEIADLLTKPNVSKVDESSRREVDSFVLDCHDRGVSMVQLGITLGLYIHPKLYCKALDRSVDRAKSDRLRV